jgi:hypothetical protein
MNAIQAMCWTIADASARTVARKPASVEHARMARSLVRSIATMQIIGGACGENLGAWKICSYCKADSTCPRRWEAALRRTSL